MSLPKTSLNFLKKSLRFTSAVLLVFVQCEIKEAAAASSHGTQEERFCEWADSKHRSLKTRRGDLV